MSLKPICVSCQRFFRPKKNGFTFLEGMPNGVTNAPTPAGKGMDEYWQPYKLWRGDLWECLGCHTEIVVGVARDRMAEHYQPGFTETVEAYATKPLFQVNDC